jgi:hypothetical protein
MGDRLQIENALSDGTETLAVKSTVQLPIVRKGFGFRGTAERLLESPDSASNIPATGISSNNERDYQPKFTPGQVSAPQLQTATRFPSSAPKP